MSDRTDELRSNLIQTIAEFREKSGEIDVEFDKFAAKEVTKWLDDQPNAQLHDLGRLMVEVATKHFFMLRVFELKLEQVLRGIEFAANSDNPTVMVALTRSCVEHLAAFVFQQEKLRSLTDTLKGQSSEKKAREALEGAARTIERLYSGQSPKGKGPVKQYNVNDFLDALATRINSIRSIYDELCEFVHPNFGSNSLVSGGTIAVGRVSIADPLDEPHKQKAFRISLIVARHLIDVSVQVKMDLLSGLMTLRNWIEIAGQPKSTLGNVFSERGLSHVGDGRSKETAIAFPKARTHSEAIDCIHRYLKDNGFEMTGLKEIGGIDDDHIYDVFNTNRGRIWFKVKMPKL